MTDNEIMKARENEIMKARENEIMKTLEYRVKYSLDIGFSKDILDLIKYYKIEIERLRNALMGECMLSKCNIKNKIKSEAIKEYLAKVKNYIKTHCNPYGKPDFDYDTSIKILNCIDLIVDTSCDEGRVNKKWTDNEIMKASVGTATDVALEPYSEQADIIADRFRELIDENNRQKAEIERLKKNIDGLNIFTTNHIKVIRLQAIKEFAERLKEKLQWDVEFDNKLVFESDIDNFVKEMMEIEK